MLPACRINTTYRNAQLLVVSLSLFILLLLALTWGAIALQINANQRNALRSAQSDVEAVAAAYEQYVLRTLRSYDNATKFLKFQLESQRGAVNLDSIVEQGMLAEPDVVLITIVNEHGDILPHSQQQQLPKVNLSDREHVRVHAESDAVGFYIGKPVIGRVSGLETVQMTRRLNHPDGSFAGVIVVSEKPSTLTDFHSLSSLGPNGYLALQGSDGAYRAIRIGDSTRPTIRTMEEGANGYKGHQGYNGYITQQEALPHKDGKPVELISASHLIEKYQLVGTVGVPRQEVLAMANERNHRYVLLGGLVSLMILLFYIAALAMIRTLRKQQREFEHMARRDMLTDLPNRLEFQRLLQERLETREAARRGVGVLFVNLDNFKNINDSLGHEVGDAFLVEAAERLRAVVRPEDCVCRFGGDEFTVILPNCPSSALAVATAQRILHALQAPYVIDSKRLCTGASIGISLYPQDGTDAGALIRHADLAMYKVKNEGKNSYRLYAKEMSEEFTSKVALEQAITNGMENHEFFPVYQPKVNMRTGQVIGVEALLRWQSPERGLVSPAEFIPLAETTGQILPLSKIVMQAACAQMRRWHDEGLGWIPTAINISAYQLSKGDLAADILEVLGAHRVPPSALEVELTESMVMDNLDRAMQTIAALKNIGIKISIDDFGTGHSSLGSLMRFPADYLKIDRSFIHNSNDEGQSIATIRTIVALAKNYHMKVIAEGVETMAQHDMLCELGCHMAQGYLYSPPVEATQIPAVIRRITSGAVPVCSSC